MTWCSSAVSCSRGFLVTACRIRATACATLARHCVRHVLWSREFPLVEALPSGDSAGARAPLFVAFISTIPSSDCSIPYVIGYGYFHSFAAPLRFRGKMETSQVPAMRTYERAWGLRHRVDRHRLTITVMSVLSSTAHTVSALQTSNLSMLNSPAHPHPCQRFT